MQARLRLPSVETAVRFAKTVRGRFRGVYPDFQTAERAIPKGKPIGCDHPALSLRYRDSIGKARDTDYPVIFWLGRALEEQKSVFDWGGHIGISYYRFRNYLHYPDDLRWHIADLPVIIKAGEEYAAEQQAPLSFTTRFEEAEGFGTLLGLGSIQYIPKHFAQSLAELKEKPKHVLLNRVPLYEGAPFVTLEAVDPSTCAYQVYNRQEFINSLRDLGYDLVDWWLTPDLSCTVRWRANRSFAAHTGLYFRKRNA